jgi:hypothetical protein
MIDKTLRANCESELLRLKMLEVRANRAHLMGCRAQGPPSAPQDLVRERFTIRKLAAFDEGFING